MILLAYYWLKIKSDAPVGIFNGVNNIHISKKYFYQEATKALSLPRPNFTKTSAPMLNKVVLGDKAQAQLNYTMQHDDILAWVKQGLQ
jgi:hypothetical protein